MQARRSPIVERTLLPTASRFDHYVAAVVNADRQLQEDLFSNDEVRGLRLFIGEAQCTRCHNGSLLTNNEFHNTGVISAAGELPDRGAQMACGRRRQSCSTAAVITAMMSNGDVRNSPTSARAPSLSAPFEPRRCATSG